MPGSMPGGGRGACPVLVPWPPFSVGTHPAQPLSTSVRGESDGGLACLLPSSRPHAGGPAHAVRGRGVCKPALLTQEADLDPRLSGVQTLKGPSKEKPQRWPRVPPHQASTAPGGPGRDQTLVWRLCSPSSPPRDPHSHFPAPPQSQWASLDRFRLYNPLQGQPGAGRPSFLPECSADY